MIQEPPFTIQLELVQGCQRKCHFCGLRGINTEILPMQKTVLKKFIELIASSGWNSKIILAMHGEPTLHPKFIECVKMLRNAFPNKPIHLMTNGLTYKKYSPKMCLEAGITNYILDLYEDTVYLPENMDMTGLVVESIEKGLYTNKTRVLINRPITESTKINRSLTNHCGAGMQAVNSPIEARCAKPFRELTVRYDGSVCVCCNDFRGEYYVENIMNCDDINTIWNHPRFIAARKRLYHRDRNFYPCSLCNAKSHRVGLLPDKLGKEDLPTATRKEKQISEIRSEPLAKIKKRKWEL